MKVEYQEALNLIKNNEKATYPTFVYSILDNFIAGQIYMDDTKRSALIGTDSGLFVVVGDCDNNSFQSMVLEIYNDTKQNNKRFTLFSPSKEWDEVINRSFDQEMRPIYRYSYEFNKNKFSTLLNNEVPREFELRKINDLKASVNQKFNEDYFNQYWGSRSNFLENGFGYHLIDDESVASECVSIFASLRFAEIDIATQESYRGKGLAQRVAEKFIEHCIERDVTPKWDCNVINLSSMKLAEKLGFENPTEYSVFVRK